jgi:hypothetical protein
VSVPRGKASLVVAAMVIVGSIVAGVILVGTPARGRLERLDARRIEDLRGIVRAIDEFHVRTDRLPTSLAELADDPRTRVFTADPGSGADYRSVTLDDRTYELCASFDLESAPSTPRQSDPFWTHGRGESCFEIEARTTP